MGLKIRQQNDVVLMSLFVLKTLLLIQVLLLTSSIIAFREHFVILIQVISLRSILLYLRFCAPWVTFMKLLLIYFYLIHYLQSISLY